MCQWQAWAGVTGIKGLNHREQMSAEPGIREIGQMRVDIH